MRHKEKWKVLFYCVAKAKRNTAWKLGKLNCWLQIIGSFPKFGECYGPVNIHVFNYGLEDFMLIQITFAKKSNDQEKWGSFILWRSGGLSYFWVSVGGYIRIYLAFRMQKLLAVWSWEKKSKNESGLRSRKNKLWRFAECATRSSAFSVG